MSMLRIRQEQMQIFEQACRLRSEDKLFAHARTVWTRRAAGLSDQELRSHVQSCIERAEGFGLRTEYETSCFLDLSFAFAPDFDQAPATAWAGALLRNASLSGWTKCLLLVERAQSELLVLEGAA
jgi:hypothetical protein